MHRRNLLAFLALVLLSSCASLPENYEREESWKLDASGSRLAAAFDQQLSAHQGQSGAYPLRQGMEALAARVVLARTAETTLDVQYYIWQADESGRLLIKELLDAADRGVRVRLLLDDIGVGAENDEAFILLDSHPNLSVSLFNPIALRDSRTMGLLADPRRMNRRMHDKSMTADNTVTVVGGRNVGNEYFSLNELINFADMDVFAVGPVASQVTDSFDVFWNSPASIPISAFHRQPATPEQLVQAREKLDAYVRKTSGPYYDAMRATPFTLELNVHGLEFYWGEIAVLYDPPEKSQLGTDVELLLQQLRNMLGKATKELLIVSPYFIPGKRGTEALIDAVSSGVRVRVVTNSLASTDVGAVHAGYKKHRRQLLEGGVELFEMMPTLNASQEVVNRFSFSGSSGASLHAKLFLFDRRRVFIGSMNLDPRSVEINTEIGLLIDNPELAEQLEANFENQFKKTCYSVVLEPVNPARPDGRRRLVWIESRQGSEIRYTEEPHTTFWQRFRVGLVGLLPVDSQL